MRFPQDTNLAEFGAGISDDGVFKIIFYFWPLFDRTVLGMKGERGNAMQQRDPYGAHTLPVELPSCSYDGVEHRTEIHKQDPCGAVPC